MCICVNIRVGDNGDQNAHRLVCSGNIKRATERKRDREWERLHVSERERGRARASKRARKGEERNDRKSDGERERARK